MLSVHQLRAGYGKREILNIEHLAFAPGKITVLIGPNGSGKSTLLKTLFGALTPRQGSVAWNDTPLHRLSAREIARRIAYVPQDGSFAFAFTVAELVGLGAEISATSQAERDRRIETALATMDLEALAPRSLQSLSGGERQRAAIARAVAQQAPCLLLDEPTAYLDLGHQSLLASFLCETARLGNTVIVVLHDLNAAAQLADTIVLLSNGRIAAQGSPWETLTPETIHSVYGTRVRIAGDSDAGSRWIMSV